MDYKGYNIQVAVYPDLNGSTFHAAYTVCRGRDTVATGTVAGGLKNLLDAESSAYAAACRYIELANGRADLRKQEAGRGD